MAPIAMTKSHNNENMPTQTHNSVVTTRPSIPKHPNIRKNDVDEPQYTGRFVLALLILCKVSNINQLFRNFVPKLSHIEYN